MKIRLLGLAAASLTALSGCGTEDEVAENVRQCEVLAEADNYAEAFSFCRRACDLKDGYGCLVTGIIYGAGYGMNQDYLQAKKYMEKACDLNNSQGCYNLGVIYDDGMGVKQDYQQAETL